MLSPVSSPLNAVPQALAPRFEGVFNRNRGADQPVTQSDSQQASKGSRKFQNIALAYLVALNTALAGALGFAAVKVVDTVNDVQSQIAQIEPVLTEVKPLIEQLGKINPDDLAAVQQALASINPEDLQALKEASSVLGALDAEDVKNLSDASDALKGLSPDDIEKFNKVLDQAEKLPGVSNLPDIPGLG